MFYIFHKLQIVTKKSTPATLRTDMHRQAGHVNKIVARDWMNHHREGGLLERARLDEVDLRAFGLLGGRAENDDRANRLVLLDCGLQRNASRDSGNANQVVATCVSDFRQRIILAAKRDDWFLGAIASAER